MNAGSLMWVPKPQNEYRKDKAGRPSSARARQQRREESGPQTVGRKHPGKTSLTYSTSTSDRMVYRPASRPSVGGISPPA
jgi:hypothetical protein